MWDVLVFLSNTGWCFQLFGPINGSGKTQETQAWRLLFLVLSLALGGPTTCERQITQKRIFSCEKQWTEDEHHTVLTRKPSFAQMFVLKQTCSMTLIKLSEMPVSTAWSFTVFVALVLSQAEIPIVQWIPYIVLSTVDSLQFYFAQDWSLDDSA